MTFLDTLRMELENFPEDQLFEPTEDVAEGEEVLMTMEPDQKTMYSLAMRWEKLSRQTMLEARYTKAGPDQSSMVLEGAKQSMQSRLLLGILWYTFVEQLGCDTFAYRADWKVVKTQQRVAIVLERRDEE